MKVKELAWLKKTKKLNKYIHIEMILVSQRKDLETSTIIIKKINKIWYCTFF